MNQEDIAVAFVKLGHALANVEDDKMALVIEKAVAENTWFDEKSVHQALQSWGVALSEANVLHWLSLSAPNFPIDFKRIGIVMAGNIPLVGLHDVLCVLLSGNKAVIKLSSDDTALMRFAIDFLSATDAWFANRLECSERLNGVDAIIATGSNNTSRYFEYYFKDIPHIIRKNRNSLAILTGDETDEELHQLGHDIFSYYGLGCRNVTHVLFPKGMSTSRFYDAIADHYEVLNHNKFANNHTYHRALFLLNQQKHLDNNFLLLKEDPMLYSPVGCLNYSYYSDQQEAEDYVVKNKEQIQVIVSKGNFSFPVVPLGMAQHPNLWDYADQINTLEFCINLK